MDHRRPDDRRIADRRLAPASPAAIWGGLMALALVAAGATAMTAKDQAQERIVAVNDGHELRQSVRQLAAERDQLQERLSRLERGVGELKLASRATAGSDVTGSISRPAAETKPAAFALSLGSDASVEAAKRRWMTLSARYPQTLAKLSPHAAPSSGRAGAYDLLAGPFPTAGEAQRACTALADQGLACDTTTFAGEPITRP